MSVPTTSIAKFNNVLPKELRNPWIRTGILLMVTILIYHSVMFELYLSWVNNHYYSHGFLIPVISLYLVFRNRDRLRKTETNTHLYGIIPAILGIVIFLFAEFSCRSLFLSSTSMIIFLMGGVLFFFGRDHLKALLFPILFLLFMIPIPDFVFNSVTGPLQLTAASIGEFVLKCLGAPVHREGIYLYLGPVTIKVARGCSAMHSLIALSALSVIVAYVILDSFSKRIVIVASSIPIAILANGFRLVLIISLIVWMGEEVLHSLFHPLSGEVLFLCDLSVLALEALILRRFGKGGGGIKSSFLTKTLGKP